MKVIFLDIDGVLNNYQTMALTPDGYTGINNGLLTRLSTIVKETNARIVLSSTWKSDWNKDESLCTNDGKYMVEKFKQKNLLIFDKIEDINGSLSTRGAAIMKYLENHQNIKDWVVIDDDEFDYVKYPEIMGRFVHTNHDKGLTDENVSQAISLLSEALYKVEGYDKDNDVYVKYWEGKDVEVAKVVGEVLSNIANKGELVRYTSDGYKEPIDWVQVSDENDELVFLNDSEELER